VTGFGDWEAADSYDPSPADPEAVARILLDLRVALAPPHPDRRRLDDLTPEDRALWVYALAFLLDRLRREGGVR
jgi:hypothetical protein